MVIKNKPDPSTPLLTKLSKYAASPKYSIVGFVPPYHPPFTLGPGVYEAGNIDKTSRYRNLSTPCSFGGAKRFAEDRISKSKLVAYPGPGAYTPKGDYSFKPYTKLPDTRLDLPGNRIFPKQYFKAGNRSPGPIYEVTGRDRRGDPTLATTAPSVAGRQGWYYDVDIKAHKDVPGPGTYKAKHPGDPTEITYGFGSSVRPPMFPAHTKGLPGPGAYDNKSNLMDNAVYSFGQAKLSAGSGFNYPQYAAGTMCAQPTQFA